KSLNSLEKSFNHWLEDISPELALQKLSAAQIGKSYVMVLFGLLLLTSVLFVLSFVVNAIHTKRAQKKLESHIEKYVANNLMSHESKEMPEFSEKFNDFTEQTSLYLNKRMSFGSIFQEALPLASILL